MRPSKLLALAAALALSAAAWPSAAGLAESASAQQTPVRDNRPKPANPAAAGPTGTASLGGTVTNDDGSRPVRNAYVVLIGTTTGVVKVSSSDNDGKFLFTALPADRYTVGVSKPPYLGTVAGARRPGKTGTAIVVADAQKVANVAVRMPMGAAITGAITDEKGVPAPNVTIALQQWRMQGAERTLVTTGGTATDDRGRYRFFGLQPGEYVLYAIRVPQPQGTRALSSAEVDAALRGAAAAPMPPSQASPVRYAPVYFPGTTRRSDARAIAVAIGEERPNVDFRLELVQTSRVEGVVLTADGQVPLANSINVGVAGSNGVVTNLRPFPDGHFEGTGIVPGDYVFTAMSAGLTPPQFASVAVTFAGADVLGLQLVLRPAMTLSGVVQFRGAGAIPDLAGRRVSIVNTTPSWPRQPTVTPTNQTGAFTVSNVLPGRYTISGMLNLGPTTASMTWALESVVLDGRDVTDLPIDVTGENAPKNVVITFTDRFQSLSGRITRTGGAPVSEHTIIVFPEDRTYWISGSRRILTTRPGTDGRFTLSGAGPTTLPPGKYLLAAVTDIDRDEQFDPAFLAALVPAAIPLSLAPGEKKVQDLVVK